MSNQKPPFCSDEELLSELQKLGYDDVSPDVLQMMKNDLSELVEKDEPYSDVSDREEGKFTTSTNTRYASGRNNYDKPLEIFSGKLQREPFEVTQIENNQPTLSQSNGLSGGEDRYSKYRNRYKHFKLNSFDSQQSDQISSDNIGSDTLETDSGRSSISVARNYSSALKKYKETPKLPEILKLRSPEVISDNEKFLHSSTPNKNISKINESINSYRNRFKLRSSQEVFKSDNTPPNNFLPSENISKDYESVNNYRSGIKPLSSQEIFDSHQNISMGLIPSENNSKLNTSIDNYRRRFVSRVSQDAVNHDEALLSTSSASEKTLKVNQSHYKHRTYFKPQSPREITNTEQRLVMKSNENIPNIKDSIINYRSRIKLHSPEKIVGFDKQILSNLSHSDKTSKVNESINKYQSRFMHQLPNKVGNIGLKILNNSIPNENITIVNESINKHQSRFKYLNINESGSMHKDMESYNNDKYNSPDIESETPSLVTEKMISYEKDDHGSTDIESEISSTSSLIAVNKMKRKVLRRKNGNPVITEVLRDIPSIFSNSYSGKESFRSSNYYSQSDLSWKPNGSTKDLSVLGSNTFGVSSSTYSTPRSLQLHYRVERKKKNDPVSMYNYYKKYWNTFKPPGEKTHDKLRWAVRDRMLDYNL